MNIHPHQPRIWYPVSLKLDHVSPAVRWVDLAGVAFDEPFFHHTVNRLAERESLVLPLGATPPVDAQPWLAPSAFIFHVSRCGSTLLCNIFRALSNTHVVAEPQPVMALLGPYSSKLWPCTEAEWAPKRDALLRQMMQRLGQPPTGSATRYIVKLASYSAMRMEVIRALWPDVPVLFLVRDPAEVIVSNMGRRPAWMKLLQRPAQTRNVFGWAEKNHPASVEEFCARAFGELCDSTLRNMGANSLVMDYRELIEGGWSRAFAFLGLDAPDAGEQARIEEATKTYSKDASGEARFKADGKVKGDRITPAISEAADRWARPSLRALLAASNEVQS